jgi:hypothetical protein
MHLLVAPTFLHIVMLLTWLIYVLIGFTVVYFFSLVVRIYFVGTWRPEWVINKEGEPTRSWKFEKGSELGTWRFLWSSSGKPALVVIVLVVLNHVARILLPRMQPSISRVALGSVVVVIFALVLFLIKVKALLVYGVLEGIFALGACVSSLEVKGRRYADSRCHCGTVHIDILNGSRHGQHKEGA